MHFMYNFVLYVHMYWAAYANVDFKSNYQVVWVTITTATGNVCIITYVIETSRPRLCFTLRILVYANKVILSYICICIYRFTYPCAWFNILVIYLHIVYEMFVCALSGCSATWHTFTFSYLHFLCTNKFVSLSQTMIMI